MTKKCKEAKYKGRLVGILHRATMVMASLQISLRTTNVGNRVSTVDGCLPPASESAQPTQPSKISDIT